MPKDAARLILCAVVKLLLASTSPYRRALLERLGLPFTTADPGVDEDVVKELGLPAEMLAVRLARAKCDAAAIPDAVTIGGDQVCALDDEILDKPGSVEGARAQLARLQGREHRLVTAICVRAGDTLHEHLDVTRLRMRPLRSDEIARYVDADRPLDCAGAYKFEARGVTLFDAVISEDVTAITGLPLLALVRILRETGFPLP